MTRLVHMLEKEALDLAPAWPKGVFALDTVRTLVAEGGQGVQLRS